MELLDSFLTFFIFLFVVFSVGSVIAWIQGGDDDTGMLLFVTVIGWLFLGVVYLIVRS